MQCVPQHGGVTALIPLSCKRCIYNFNIYIVCIYIYIYGTPPKTNTFRQIGEVGGTNKSESAMCMWHLIKMLNEHPPTSDHIYMYIFSVYVYTIYNFIWSLPRNLQPLLHMILQIPWQAEKKYNLKTP